jgi:Cys-tRNA(Pro)/Cys-tRNA(Cys) deacylase
MRRVGARVTPAVVALRDAGIDHELHVYDLADRARGGFAEEAARHLGLDPARVFKTLVVALDRDSTRLGVVIAPAAADVDLSAAAAALGAKRAALADPGRAERTTGYVVGGISPFGQRRRLPTVLDASAATFPTIFVSGGRRGLELEVAPADLVRALDAQEADVRRG